MKEEKYSEAADALASHEELLKRRAARVPLSSPLALPPGAVVCRYVKDHICDCGGKGHCLDVA